MSGDVLFNGSIGRTETRLKDLILDVFKEVLGEEGTMVSLSFTKQFPFFNVDKDFVFNKKTISISGALPNLMIKQENSFRSRHPGSSFVAIGKNAEYITSECKSSKEPN